MVMPLLQFDFCILPAFHHKHPLALPCFHSSASIYHPNGPNDPNGPDDRDGPNSKRSLAGGGSGMEQSDSSVCGLIGHLFLQNIITSLS